MGKVLCALLRIIHIILAALVLGLSINAVNWQYYGDAPATNGFAAFAGGFGALAGLIGFAAIWITPLGGYVTLVFDLLASIFFLAGGIVSLWIRCLSKNIPATDC